MKAIRLLCLVFAALELVTPAFASSEGAIHNHLTLDLLPVTFSKYNPAGLGAGVSYDQYYDALKTAYTLSFETSSPYTFDGRTDLIASIAFATEVTRAFSIGARIGVIANAPEHPLGFGAAVLRLPALVPEAKGFFSFFYEEVDLGLVGPGKSYASFRLAMTLF